jgi:transcriptional regulator with XRE-family HTH domain
MLRLKEILEKKRMSQVELSRILGVSTVSVNLWAQHKSEPSLKMTLKICEALNITLNELVDQKSE